MTIRPLYLSLLLSLTLGACGESDADTTETPEVPPAATAPAEPAAEAPTEAEPPPEGEALGEAEPPAPGDTVSLLALREGFAEDAEAWTGREITVNAQFMSATRANGQLNNVSLVVSAEDYAEDLLHNSVMCAFGDDAPDSVDLTQYAEVTVRGTVTERFGRASLDDCQIVSE